MTPDRKGAWRRNDRKFTDSLKTACPTKEDSRSVTAWRVCTASPHSYNRSYSNSFCQDQRAHKKLPNCSHLVPDNKTNSRTVCRLTRPSLLPYTWASSNPAQAPPVEYAIGVERRGEAAGCTTSVRFPAKVIICSRLQNANTDTGFSGGLKLTAQFHTVRKLRMSGVIPPLHIYYTPSNLR